jgi:hypothetical protein
MPSSIAVVYLARGIPSGIDSAEAFFASYESHDAGIAHTLWVIVKGWENTPGLDRLNALATRFGAKVTALPDDGFDFGAYFRAATVLRDDWICLMNTNSRIRVPSWLLRLHHAALRADVGAAGATGSWESLVRDAYVSMRSQGWLAPRALARVAANWMRFPAFPNPHLRSNAILTRMSLFKEFSRRCRIPRTKREAYRLESGRSGFSAFLRSRRLAPVVCGADNGVYYPPDWPASGTFRSLGQHNLLVADNQTLQYEAEAHIGRHSLQLATWGRTVDDSV